MTPQAKITGWSAHLSVDGQSVIMTVSACSRATAAKRLQFITGRPIKAKGLSRTVTVALRDHGNPLFWAQPEMDLSECEPCE